jgi:hypothetical protein
MTTAAHILAANASQYERAPAIDLDFRFLPPEALRYE